MMKQVADKFIMVSYISEILEKQMGNKDGNE